MDMYSLNMTAQDQVPFIYVCSTMWHETEQEMVQVLTSLLRNPVFSEADEWELGVVRLTTAEPEFRFTGLDQYHTTRIRQQNETGINDPTHYDFEVHIFFDDAMDVFENTTAACNVNDYVKTFIKAMATASNNIHEEGVVAACPEKYTTPYGGRLDWTMPGGNCLKVHLKDKYRIRSKKRWSQVMSMQYLLNYASRETENVLKAGLLYLLHLDGDADFSPDALTDLVRLMAEDNSVGAVCGRIHPEGSGPFIWCQKFEYSLALWLQKTTEDTLGSVLCSPGCFSLLRGSALLDVLPTFSTPSSQARNFITEEQGEDRWLTSLLIQQGWQSRYSSISQSHTMAPQTLEEYFKQRRRWTPSTFMHTLDLILDWREFTKINQKMSLGFIIYQTYLFITTIAASSSILLSLAGALNTLSNEYIPFTASVLIGSAPIALFSGICLAFGQQTQLNAAKFLSGVFGLIQLLVLGTVVYQLAVGGLCSPSIILLLCLCLTLLLIGLAHTNEFSQVFYAIVYFFFIPCVYVIMVIYAYSNLHVMGWGTRERHGEVASSESSPIKSFFISGFMEKCHCRNEETKYHQLVESDDWALDSIVSSLKEEPKKTVEYDLTISKDAQSCLEAVQEGVIIPVSETIAPTWIHNDALGDGPIRSLPREEIHFFQNLIEDQLLPLKLSEDEQVRISEGLVKLRNQVLAAFYALNVIFISGVLLLEETTSRMQIRGLCGKETSVQPRSLLLSVLFGVTFFVQVLGLIVHRAKALVRVLRSRYATHKRHSLNAV